jgi:peptidoglycan/LPS O-acetylase OafA/YrhL
MLNRNLPGLDHYWSLDVEEQFYALVFVMLARVLRTAPGRMITVVAPELSLYLAVVGMTMAVAWLSYVVFERPFLDLKGRYAIVATSATA